MRKYIAILLAVLLMAGTAFAATPGRDLSPGKGDIMGNVGRYDFDAHKTFRLVRYVPADNSAVSTTLTANSLVIWDTTSDDGVTVTTTATSANAAVAGIIVQQALTPQTLGNTATQDYAKRNWTWLQTYGLATAALADDEGVVAAGSPIAIGADKGTVTGYNSAISPFGASCGFAYDDIAASGTDSEVFLRCE